jgi:hypothetical protein
MGAVLVTISLWYRISFLPLPKTVMLRLEPIFWHWILTACLTEIRQMTLISLQIQTLSDVFEFCLLISCCLLFFNSEKSLAKGYGYSV